MAHICSNDSKAVEAKTWCGTSDNRCLGRNIIQEIWIKMPIFSFKQRHLKCCLQNGCHLFNRCRFRVGLKTYKHPAAIITEADVILGEICCYTSRKFYNNWLRRVCAMLIDDINFNRLIIGNKYYEIDIWFHDMVCFTARCIVNIGTYRVHGLEYSRNPYFYYTSNDLTCKYIVNRFSKTIYIQIVCISPI